MLQQIWHQYKGNYALLVFNAEDGKVATPITQVCTHDPKYRVKVALKSKVMFA